MQKAETNNWQTAQYLNLSTQKRDGSWVDTPVWFAPDATNSCLYVFSEGKAGKVKRIRNFPSVKVNPCSVTGHLAGAWEVAQAEILQSLPVQREAYQWLRKKYGWKLALLDLGSRLAGKINQRAFIRLTLHKNGGDGNRSNK